MALVTESGLQGNLHRQDPLLQQTFDLIDADRLQITVGGDAFLLSKLAEQLILAKSVNSVS